MYAVTPDIQQKDALGTATTTAVLYEKMRLAQNESTANISHHVATVNATEADREIKELTKRLKTVKVT